MLTKISHRSQRQRSFDDIFPVQTLSEQVVFKLLPPSENVFLATIHTVIRLVEICFVNLWFFSGSIPISIFFCFVIDAFGRSIGRSVICLATKQSYLIGNG